MLKLDFTLIKKMAIIKIMGPLEELYIFFSDFEKKKIVGSEIFLGPFRLW